MCISYIYIYIYSLLRENTLGKADADPGTLSSEDAARGKVNSCEESRLSIEPLAAKQAHSAVHGGRYEADKARLRRGSRKAA